MFKRPRRHPIPYTESNKVLRHNIIIVTMKLLTKDNSRLWEPHTSSIDFCETNYLHTNYIVEIHNTWSSVVGLSLFGVIGLTMGNHLGETRNIIAYLALVLIGVGSAGLHGTLHWFLQSADEVPMMYLMISLIYLCAEHDAPVGKPNYPRLPEMLAGLALGNTIVYYCLQQLYFAFLFTFAIEATIVITWLHQIIYGKKGRSKETQRICNTGILSILVAALPCWLFDMLHCRMFIERVNQKLGGMTPHVLWHFGAGFGAYCAIVTLECCRMEEMGSAFKTRFLCGVFPVIERCTPKD